jgi:RNA polymerase sigma factor (sigma-70 family)
VRERFERGTLRALRQGRREAYAEVIEAQYSSIYRLMLLLSGDATLAEDLTQETFASAWAAIHRFRGHASVKTWLHRIAYNCLTDVRRRRRREDALAEKLDRPWAETAAGPLSRVMAEERLCRICEALDGLETGERAMLILHYVEGLSYREMAKVLGWPSGTLKWKTSRALEKLRRQLAGKVEP